MAVETVDMEESDRALEKRIGNFLAICGINSAKRLKVHVAQGTVTIAGMVSSFYQRQLCIHACRRVAGVYRLIDQIAVIEPANRQQLLKIAV